MCYSIIVVTAYKHPGHFKDKFVVTFSKTVQVRVMKYRPTYTTLSARYAAQQHEK